jgi:hypothetical protein
VSTRTYDLHGVSLEIAADDDAAGDALDQRLWYFRGTPVADPDLRFAFETVAAQEGGRAQGRPVYAWDMGDVLYADDGERLSIDVGTGARVRADVRRGRAVVTSLADLPDRAWLLSRPLLTLPLVETLKWRGLYSLHAAGAADGDGVILLPGPSGSGKSTLSLALARAGLGYLSDDMVFLSGGAEGLRVLAFPDEADVSADTAGWFPELEPLVARAEPGWPKHRVRVDETFGATVADSGVPRALVFPTVSGDARSTLEPMSGAEALTLLAPNVLLTHPGHAQAHLDVLGALARETPCFRLTTGRDVDRVADVVRSALG